MTHLEPITLDADLLALVAQRDVIKRQLDDDGETPHIKKLAHACDLLDATIIRTAALTDEGRAAKRRVWDDAMFDAAGDLLLDLFDEIDGAERVAA